MLLRRVIPCLDVDKGRVVKGVEFVDLRDAGDPVELAVRYQDAGRGRDRLPRHHRLAREARHRGRPGAALRRRRVHPLHDRRRRALGGGRPGRARRGRRQGVGELRRRGAARAARRAGRGVRRPVRGAGDRRPARRRTGYGVYVNGGRTPVGPRRRRMGARGRGARRGGDTAHEHGPRRHRGRLRAGAHPGGRGRRGRARDRLGRGGRRSTTSSRPCEEGGADAVLCASIFHYGQYSVREAKEHMRRAGVPVRL